MFSGACHTFYVLMYYAESAIWTPSLHKIYKLLPILDVCKYYRRGISLCVAKFYFGEWFMTQLHLCDFDSILKTFSSILLCLKAYIQIICMKSRKSWFWLFQNITCIFQDNKISKRKSAHLTWEEVRNLNTLPCHSVFFFTKGH